MPLPRVNGLVDIINWCSAETQIAFGLYDLARVQPPITLRLGAAGEGYDGIRKDRVNVEGRLTLADAHGPVRQPDLGFGADDDDAGDDRGAGRAVRARECCRARSGERALALTRERLAEYAGGVDRTTCRFSLSIRNET